MFPQTESESNRAGHAQSFLTSKNSRYHYFHIKVLLKECVLVVVVVAGPTRAPVYKQDPVYKRLFMFVYLPSRLE